MPTISYERAAGFLLLAGHTGAGAASRCANRRHGVREAMPRTVCSFDLSTLVHKDKDKIKLPNEIAYWRVPETV